MFKQVIKHNTK